MSSSNVSAVSRLVQPSECAVLGVVDELGDAEVDSNRVIDRHISRRRLVWVLSVLDADTENPISGFLFLEADLGDVCVVWE